MAITNFLKKLLPWIGAAVSGNIPGLVTLATKQIGEVVGTKVAPTLDSIAQAVAGATPEQMLKFREIETQFQLRAQELGFQNIQEFEAISERDRESARQREVQIRDWTPRVLAYVVVVLAAAGEGFILVHGAPIGLDGVVLGRILGTLDAALILVLSYYFGSSAGSAEKSKTLDKLTNGKNNA